MEGQGGITTGSDGAPKEIAAAVTTTSATATSGTKNDGSKTQTINGRYNSFVIMKHVSIDIASFNKLNPNFDRQIAYNGTYELKLPDDKMDIFLAKKPEILNESMQLLMNAGGPR